MNGKYYINWINWVPLDIARFKSSQLYKDTCNTFTDYIKSIQSNSDRTNLNKLKGIDNAIYYDRDFNFDYSWNGELDEFLDLVLLSKSSRELPIIIREIRDLIDFLKSNRTFTLL
jgi:hypothetical protein